MLNRIDPEPLARVFKTNTTCSDVRAAREVEGIRGVHEMHQ